MGKSKQKYNDVVLPRPKKSLDITEKLGNNVQEDEISLQEVLETMAAIKKNVEAVAFNPTVNSYVSFYNSKTKKYELLTVAIDTETNRMELFRKELNCDNESSAIMAMQKCYADDLTKKIKDRRDNERNAEIERAKKGDS